MALHSQQYGAVYAGKVLLEELDSHQLGKDQLRAHQENPRVRDTGKEYAGFPAADAEVYSENQGPGAVVGTCADAHSKSKVHSALEVAISAAECEADLPGEATSGPAAPLQE